MYKQRRQSNQAAAAVSGSSRLRTRRFDAPSTHSSIAACRSHTSIHVMISVFTKRTCDIISYEYFYLVLALNNRVLALRSQCKREIYKGIEGFWHTYGPLIATNKKQSPLEKKAFGISNLTIEIFMFARQGWLSLRFRLYFMSTSNRIAASL